MPLSVEEEDGKGEWRMSGMQGTGNPERRYRVDVCRLTSKSLPGEIASQDPLQDDSCRKIKLNRHTPCATRHTQSDSSALHLWISQSCVSNYFFMRLHGSREGIQW